MNDSRNPEDIPDPRPGSTELGRTDGVGVYDRRKEKEKAEDRLEEIQAIEEPVERIKQLAVFFRSGAGKTIMSDLDMEELLFNAKRRAFREIRAIAEQAERPAEYLKDVRFELDLADDYTWSMSGVLTKVQRKVDKLLERYSDNEEDSPTQADHQRLRFRGPRSSLRRLLNGIYEGWMDKDEVGKEEFFRVVGQHFETDHGPVDAQEAKRMRKKAGGYPPADAQKIDALLDSVPNRES